MRLGAAFERLDRLVNWERRERAAGKERLMRVSLEPARDLCERLGSPERDFPVVHVAGSKGKGTVAAWIGAGLRASGLREGIYASPHVERVQERLTIAGAPVGDEELAAALERALAAHEAALADQGPARDATWFDVLTAAAFLALSEARVDAAVLECGLGGRLDSTNVARGEVCVFTNVYLEHTEILGKTRAEIAAEKAGIIKQGALVVSAVGPSGDEAADVIERRARELGARLFLRVEIRESDSIDERNRALASAVLGELGTIPAFSATGAIDARLDRIVLAGARLPGRSERRRAGGVRVVLDGAHVPESLELLLRDLAADPELAAAPVVVLGMGRDKDAQGLLKALQGRVDRVLCTSVGDGPYRDPMDLLRMSETTGLPAAVCDSPRSALETALRRAREDRRWVLVTGSLHLVGAVRGLTEADPRSP